MKCFTTLWIIGVTLATAAAGAPPQAPETPWALRDHLTFPSDRAAFLYDIERGQLRFKSDQAGVVLAQAGFEVVLADGTVLAPIDLEKASFTREPFTAGTDNGTVWTSTFPAKDGLIVRYAIVSSRTEPFLEIRMAVENTGAAPIEVAALRPVVIGPDCMNPLGATARLSQWPFQAHGAHAVLAPNAPSVLSMFCDPIQKFCLALGVAPKGVASSGGTFVPSGSAWQGAITSRFDPPVSLAPGARLAADPIWVSYGLAAPSRVVPHYAWAWHSALGNDPIAAAPKCWVTTESGASAADLYATVKTWASDNIRHALVPGAWEGRPGSLRGAVPRYPKDMKTVADTIRAMAMVPGLTLDPLVVPSGKAGWTALSADGRRWLDVSVPAARKYGAARIRKIGQWGFRFLVLQPSDIPDEVLRHFNMTRAQADGLAFQMARDAVGRIPVVPAAAATLRADPALWREAARCTSVISAHQVPLGPVRLDITGLAAIDDDLAAALQDFAAPVELVGNPSRAVRKRLARLLTTAPDPG